MSLDDAHVAAATSVFAFCKKQGIYFADAEVSVTINRRKISLRGSSLGLGEELSRRRCRSELLERWAHLEWELAGSPELTGRGISTGQTYTGLLQPGMAAAGEDPDGSGYCAGPAPDKHHIVAHGLMEVIERDSVVRLFDRHEVSLFDSTSSIPEALHCLLRGQKAAAEAWIVQRPGLPPTAVALVRCQSTGAAAVGTACKYTDHDAIYRAVLEGVMMLTTVRHTLRMDTPPPQMDGILWASNHSTALREELRAKQATRATAPTHIPEDLSALAAGVQSALGSEPIAVHFPLKRSRVSATEVWRVLVPGALNPAQAKRKPWPVG
ncbi:YcaO-like family protein [Streptomyces sp. NPDC058740]|uniref:YcaO-like family protein n=1 Tax=Streptomyces sp. NPDC058740 TaxID=3346619 RepID=UPI00369A8880